MNREGIRRLAAEELGIPTSPYRFASDYEEFVEAVGQIGTPCVVKPVMSSSGHGQSVVRSSEEIDRAWENSQKGGRAGAGRVIVEGFVDFDYEITLLTVRHCGGTSFLEPIGHYQQDGDYRESWQPQPMNPAVRAQAEEIARRITEALGGWGLFGVELFVRGDRVIFSEVSPRPHDTGMVTMISQDLSEFALHVRAVLGLPIPNIAFHGPSASRPSWSRETRTGWNSPTSRTCFRNPIRRFGFSVSPRSKATGAWPFCSRAPRASNRREKRRRAPTPNCKSTYSTAKRNRSKYPF